MVHRRFFATEEEANEAFEAMKAEPARIVDLILIRDGPQASERSSMVAEEVRGFIQAFP